MPLDDKKSSHRNDAISAPTSIEVRGARMNNLKNIDVDVPLQRLVAIAGVSGSGKSSLALGVLYAEGSRRYIEALSTYTRRRMSHAPRAAVDSVKHVPAALALRQRPSTPSVRSTFGTSTELLNVLRLMYSRLGSHVCPNGHRLEPTSRVAEDSDLTCPVCRVLFTPFGAESFAFNSDGACATCSGTGIVREIDESRLVPNPNKAITEGAVASWSLFGLAVMPQVVAEFGVRTDIPYKDLTNKEKHIVMHGPEEKRLISVPSKSGKLFDLNFTYRNARLAVEEAIKNANTEKGVARVGQFITTQVCHTCHGTRLKDEALATHISGKNIAEVTSLSLDELLEWAPQVIEDLPTEIKSMAKNLTSKLNEMASRLVGLGLGYIALDRSSSTLSTGERQRTQLARAVRNETTGVLYVLDEPSIGLHPVNVDGLLGTMRDLLRDGNSIVMVDHDTQILKQADWLIEIGPGSGSDGGIVIGEGTVEEIGNNPHSVIGGFLSGKEPVVVRKRSEDTEVFSKGALRLETKPLHTVKALNVVIPKNKLTTITGVSGSGKTTLILESLVPALQAVSTGISMPQHIVDFDADGLSKAIIIDASPIGVNIRSTIATYSGILDDLRRAYASATLAKQRKLTAADFSYNTGSLRCPRCEGTGRIVLDVQFLPDVMIICPECNGSRYAKAANGIQLTSIVNGTELKISLPELLKLTTKEAAEYTKNIPSVQKKLQSLVDIGLGYLTLGEDTPALSGGEAQRLKLSTELHREQANALFVFDEPSIGLHPLDIRTLLTVLQKLVDKGATVIVIEHDLDVIANADYVIDMGPGGGERGGEIIAADTPSNLVNDLQSVTGRYLLKHLGSNSA